MHSTYLCCGGTQICRKSRCFVNIHNHIVRTTKYHLSIMRVKLCIRFIWNPHPPLKTRNVAQLLYNLLHRWLWWWWSWSWCATWSICTAWWLTRMNMCQQGLWHGINCNCTIRCTFCYPSVCKEQGVRQRLKMSARSLQRTIFAIEANMYFIACENEYAYGNITREKCIKSMCVFVVKWTRVFIFIWMCHLQVNVFTCVQLDESTWHQAD